MNECVNGALLSRSKYILPFAFSVKQDKDSRLEREDLSKVLNEVYQLNNYSISCLKNLLRNDVKA